MKLACVLIQVLVQTPFPGRLPLELEKGQAMLIHNEKKDLEKIYGQRRSIEGENIRDRASTQNKRRNNCCRMNLNNFVPKRKSIAFLGTITVIVNTSQRFSE